MAGIWRHFPRSEAYFQNCHLSERRESVLTYWLGASRKIPTELPYHSASRVRSRMLRVNALGLHLRGIHPRDVLASRKRASLVNALHRRSVQHEGLWCSSDQQGNQKRQIFMPLLQKRYGLHAATSKRLRQRISCTGHVIARTMYVLLGQTWLRSRSSARGGSCLFLVRTSHESSYSLA